MTHQNRESFPVALGNDARFTSLLGLTPSFSIRTAMSGGGCTLSAYSRNATEVRKVLDRLPTHMVSAFEKILCHTVITNRLVLQHKVLPQRFLGHHPDLYQPEQQHRKKVIVRSKVSVRIWTGLPFPTSNAMVI